MQDQKESISHQAAENLGLIAPRTVKVDQLASDLANEALASQEFRLPYARALRAVLQAGGGRLKPEVLDAVGEKLGAC